ncbi:MAG TPA: hypothetical protein VN248_07165 [Arenimonas sp.]|nr:hypothetical protein [Arenimonas sp.]
MSLPNSIEPIAPAEALKRQRLQLRNRLSAQRRVIMQKLGPVRPEGAGTYPRSRTMRFLKEHPDLVRKLLGQGALLALGGPLFKSLVSGMAFAKLLRGGDRR